MNKTVEDAQEPWSIESNQKRRRGRPPKMVAKIEDSPENVPKALFGIKSDIQGKVTVK